MNVSIRALHSYTFPPTIQRHFASPTAPGTVYTKVYSTTPDPRYQPPHQPAYTCLGIYGTVQLLELIVTDTVVFHGKRFT